MATLAAATTTQEMKITKVLRRSATRGRSSVTSVHNATRNAAALFHSPTHPTQPSSRTSTSAAARVRTRTMTDENGRQEEASNSLVSSGREYSDFEEDENVDVQPKAARVGPQCKLSKDAKAARRREQNRKAQRALRERKEARFREVILCSLVLL
jgi:hypothetical protein